MPCLEKLLSIFFHQTANFGKFVLAKSSSACQANHGGQPEFRLQSPTAHMNMGRLASFTPAVKPKFVLPDGFD